MKLLFIKKTVKRIIFSRPTVTNGISLLVHPQSLHHKKRTALSTIASTYVDFFLKKCKLQVFPLFSVYRRVLLSYQSLISIQRTQKKGTLPSLPTGPAVTLFLQRRLQQSRLTLFLQRRLQQSPPTPQGPSQGLPTPQGLSQPR